MSIYINNPRNKIFCFAREAIRAQWNGFPRLQGMPKMDPKSMFFSLFSCMQQMSPILKPRSAPQRPQGRQKSLKGWPKVPKRGPKREQNEEKYKKLENL